MVGSCRGILGIFYEWVCLVAGAVGVACRRLRRTTVDLLGLSCNLCEFFFWALDLIYFSFHQNLIGYYIAPKSRLPHGTGTWDRILVK